MREALNDIDYNAGTIHDVLRAINNDRITEFLEKYIEHKMDRHHEQQQSRLLDISSEIMINRAELQQIVELLRSIDYSITKDGERSLPEVNRSMMEQPED
jgi:hypothetical protein